jgi:hypothetical protein
VPPMIRVPSAASGRASGMRMGSRVKKYFGDLVTGTAVRRSPTAGRGPTPTSGSTSPTHCVPQDPSGGLQGERRSPRHPDLVLRGQWRRPAAGGCRRSRPATGRPVRPEYRRRQPLRPDR